MCEIDTWWEAAAEDRVLSSALCDYLEGWVGGGREVQEEGDVYICIADSLCCTAETNSTLKSNYIISPPQKKERQKLVNPHQPNSH